MSLQLHRWTRSRRLLVLVAVFAFSGLTSPLFAAHLKELLTGLNSNGIQVVVPDPTWDGLIASYFKNAAQLALLVACYVVGSMVALGADPAVRIHYLTRVQRPSQVLLPRLGTAAVLTLAGTLVGGLCALYETVLLVDGTDLGRAVLALVVQCVAVLLLSCIAGALAFRTNSPFVSTLVVSGAVFVFGLLDSSPAVRRWSPTTLAQPTQLLSGKVELADLLPGALVLVGLTALALVAAAAPWRHSTRSAPHLRHAGARTFGRVDVGHQPNS